MTYSDFEESVEGGRPIELYTFTTGSTVVRYTSAEDTISILGNTYFSRPIRRTSPVVAQEDRRQTLEITIPANDVVATPYLGVPPSDKTEVEITSFHRTDTDLVTVWKGKVVGAGFINDGNICKMQTVTIESAMSRSIPRFKYQSQCNHVLYDGRCQVSKASFTYTGTVGAVSGNTIEVVGLEASKGAGWAVGGYVQIVGSTDYRLVRVQSGDTLTIPLPFADSPSGAIANVVAGCKHTTDDCENKFSNLINYGGFPHVPSKNPFQVGTRR